ncbi:hypothetical protein HPB52_016775 [Rhipicephalus sanguineus]|uniref:Uncharacterized protein n=1 Tax=Rhipicephalus sanguineus TaxID=34632 RepID=A0A9D4SP58_RHISA|nr:hypothetical protein HPB52_016775 [Rhipicephalus sanguineus]
MAPFSIADEREELQLDIEELAAFYLSLQAYRARVGDAVAIPGSLLNSDSLFLLYYVYNNCLAVSNGKAGDDPKGGGGYGVNRAPSLDSRRRRVDSVAAMFDVFEGLGQLKDFEYDMKLKPGAVGVVVPARTVPVALQDKVKA